MVPQMHQPIKLQQKVLEGRRPGPHLLITGGVHGDEFEPMVAIRQLMRAVDPKLLSGKLTLVPVANESAYGNLHRCGADGLDLARTFPGCPEGSVTEQTAAVVSRLIRTADYYIDLHTGGTTLSVSPLAGYVLHSVPEVLEKQREMARAFNLPVVWGTSPDRNTSSLSVARDANIPAIYAEYLGSAVCHPEGIEAYVEGCLNVMGLVGMIDHQVHSSRVEHTVEDARPQSGYMQTKNPAPIDGYFQAQVVLGQRVTAGDLLGVVSDELGDVCEEVRFTQTGLVLVLRTFPRVSQGDGLGVVLELET
jgi:predicted deacylase